MINKVYNNQVCRSVSKLLLRSVSRCTLNWRFSCQISLLHFGLVNEISKLYFAQWLHISKKSCMIFCSSLMFYIFQTLRIYLYDYIYTVSTVCMFGENDPLPAITHAPHGNNLLHTKHLFELRTLSMPLLGICCYQPHVNRPVDAQ